MSARVDKFCDQLRDRLNELEDQLGALKTNVQKLPQQGEVALQKCLKDSRSRIEEQKKKVEQARASLKDRAEQKIAQAKEAIKEWKAKREVAKLNSRADRAEQYAAAALFIATGALVEAEEAIIEALVARKDADAVESPTVAGAK
ncbi:MAG TPA: hypothetical protein VHK01_02835 [Lacipirellulaceae bacterium]|jgi:TolA-binding protein|nr:hypothetical protein [Lacipirellulaceae bacterium]